MIQMNWGHKIALLYIGFVAMIITLVFLASNQKVDLVSADYYDQEIKFQGKIDAINNMNTLSGTIVCEAKDKSVHISFPKELLEKNATGTIRLYRPSDASLDLQTKLIIDIKNDQVISSGKFKRGLYKMQINWKMENKDYYFEESIFMN
ncbi:MAG: FixH family protein [Bacteroidetes bacterium]|nr:FixH family protein [Bacteroidota bacterium]